MIDTNFTAQDAQALVAHAESAPLVHLSHAQKVSQLIHKFTAWFDSTKQEAESVKAKIKAEVEKVKAEYEASEQKLTAEIAELKAKLGTGV